jgi:prophage DNA circulation protein
MADETQILRGFLGALPISIRSGSVVGGIKHAVKQFPNRNTQSVETLGLLPRKFSLEIVVSDKTNQDYFQYKTALLALLESGAETILIHPLFGRIENIIAVGYSLNEIFSEFGRTTVSVNFEINENTGIPQASGNVITQIAASNDAVVAAVDADISENFDVTSAFTGNFTAAVGKVNGIIDVAREATSFIGDTADTINEFSATLGELSANVNSLVSDPLALASAITGLFESVNGLYASTGATFDTFLGFFGFGEDDTEIREDTAGRIERKKNNGVLNGAVSSLSLGYAYLAASSIDFETTRQIDELAAQLDTQFDTVQTGGSSQDVKDSVTDMRIKVLEVLDQARVNASQIITVHTVTTSARLLAFSYYGNDDLGQAIVDLNGFTDVSFVEGDVEVLTA